MVFIGATVNIVSVVKEKGFSSAMSTLFGSVALLASLAAIGEFFDWGLATALAAIYVLASFLTRGTGAIDWFNKLVQGL